MASRLISNPFDRPETSRTPRRCVFLSVEGNNTEADYFTCLNEFLNGYADSFDKTPILEVHVLERGQDDGHSSPQGVVELMEECLSLREVSEDGDLFAVVLDCDYPHPNDADDVRRKRTQLENAERDCESENILFYLTNPCFEFWLLLHLRDVKNAYSVEKLEAFRENRKFNNRHTAISKEVSDIIGINCKKKKLSAVFARDFWPNIPAAMRRSQDFSTAFPEIYDNLGTNLADLMERIGFPLPPLESVRDGRGRAGQKRDITRNRL